MNIIENSLYITIACMGTLSSVLFFLYYRYRERSMLVWAINGLVSIAGYVSNLAFIDSLSQGIHNPVFFLTFLPTALFLLKGMTLYLGKRMHRFWYLLTTFFIMWLLIGILFQWEDFSVYFPVCTYFSAVYAYIGINFLRSRGEKNVGTIITGNSFLFFSILTLGYPFSTITPEYVSVGLLLQSIATIILVVGLLLIYFDKNMSQLKRNEEALLVAKQAAEMANQAKSEFLANMSDALLIVDNGKIKAGNSAASSLLEYSEIELLDKPIEVLFDQASSNRSVPEHSKENILKRDIIQDLEIVVNSKSGKKIPVSLTKTIILDPDRNLQVHIYILCDLTDKKRAEENLQLLRKLNETNQLKTKIITWAAHELKTPLTPILGYVDLLYQTKKNGKESPLNLEDFEILLHSTKRLVKIVDNFLDVGRLQDGNFPIIRENVDLNRLVQDAIKIVEFQASQKKIAVNTEITHVSANIDKERMEQVLINLLSNAVKYSPENTKIEIKVDQIKNSENFFARITIIDQGYGFTQDEIEHAFLPFGKIYTRQDQKKFITGTGLGLYISKNIVESHGGTIEIHSDGINKGTQVEVIVPC